MAVASPELRVFGVRHHGPGCARALRAALQDYDPEIVLIEGPPEADRLAELAAAATPPVALVVYDPEAPREAAFFPFEEYSPEWQALRWALAAERPARFIDLPQAARRALPPEPPDAPREAPFAELAEAAGFPDHALWWEHQVELRRDVTGLFEGILEAMRAIREDSLTPTSRREALREAWMRRQIRRATRAHARVAVVCGAWHAPALLHPFPKAHDDALLKGLSRKRLAATWVPWTSTRLAARSGYGAGVESPGWYRHLWEAHADGAVRWIAQAARLMREAGLDVSSAHVISAARLAEALAALRGYAAPGRDELSEAMQATLCHGEPGPMALIRDQLEVGQRMGEVPPNTPTVPLQQDFEATRKLLRMRKLPYTTELLLDLREPRHREKSELLHRLDALGVPWGQAQALEGRERTTAKERWALRWDVDYDLRLIEANTWGNTLPAAAEAALVDRADAARDLAALTSLLDLAALAALPAAARHVLDALRDRAALSDDVLRLMGALGPLIRVRRYGDARSTPAEALDPVIEGLLERIIIGLPRACGALDEDAARAMAEALAVLDEGLALLGRAELLQGWREMVERLATGEGAALIRGRATRLLLEAGALAPERLDALAHQALSPALPAYEAAAWLEGVVSGSGLLLLHQDGLWASLDAWLGELEPAHFIALLPVVRRAFSGFSPAERRRMGERVRGLGRPVPATKPPELDRARAAWVLPTLRTLLEGTHA
ncbi:MAG: hypothetical protein H6741_32870 [Alphaproteobacteria bacterium]|nr:hypothetical protein [Alphaproteobacteria bacterium]MCB9797509.1 hypothetical protein [Alphaproteobacteria bacterium]